MATATKTRPRKRAGKKSAAIRAYLHTDPAAGPTAVVRALKAKGVLVSAAHVSNVKATLARHAAEGGGAAGATNGAALAPHNGRQSIATSDAVSVSQLLEARKFAAHVGGVQRAVRLLQTLAMLQ
jgi:hypothetical protein